MVISELLQVPPVVASASVVVAPAQTDVEPVIVPAVAGTVVTLIVVVEVDEPQLLLTV